MQLKSNFLNTDTNTLTTQDGSRSLKFKSHDWFPQSLEALNTHIPSILVNINTKHALTLIYECTHTLRVRPCCWNQGCLWSNGDIWETQGVWRTTFIWNAFSLLGKDSSPQKHCLCQLSSRGVILWKITNQPLLMVEDFRLFFFKIGLFYSPQVTKWLDWIIYVCLKVLAVSQRTDSTEIPQWWQKSQLSLMKRRKSEQLCDFTNRGFYPKI